MPTNLYPTKCNPHATQLGFLSIFSDTLHIIWLEVVSESLLNSAKEVSTIKIPNNTNWRVIYYKALGIDQYAYLVNVPVIMIWLIVKWKLFVILIVYLYYTTLSTIVNVSVYRYIQHWLIIDNVRRETNGHFSPEILLYLDIFWYS